jgi:hypothetical protein
MRRDGFAAQLVGALARDPEPIELRRVAHLSSGSFSRRLIAALARRPFWSVDAGAAIAPYDAPVTVEEQAAPVRVEEQAAPVRVEEQAAPVRVEEQAAPVRVEEQAAPVRVEEQAAPDIAEERFDERIRAIADRPPIERLRQRKSILRLSMLLMVIYMAHRVFTTSARLAAQSRPTGTPRSAQPSRQIELAAELLKEVTTEMLNNPLLSERNRLTLNKLSARLDYASSGSLPKDEPILNALRTTLPAVEEEAIALLVDIDFRPGQPKMERVPRFAPDLLDLLRISASDFSDADLSDGELQEAFLDGLTWSSSTRWPDDWREYIERNSVRLSEMTYRIEFGLNLPAEALQPT